MYGDPATGLSWHHVPKMGGSWVHEAMRRLTGSAPVTEQYAHDPAVHAGTTFLAATLRHPVAWYKQFWSFVHAPGTATFRALHEPHTKAMAGAHILPFDWLPPRLWQLTAAADFNAWLANVLALPVQGVVSEMLARYRVTDADWIGLAENLEPDWRWLLSGPLAASYDQGALAAVDWTHAYPDARAVATFDPALRTQLLAAEAEGVALWESIRDGLYRALPPAELDAVNATLSAYLDLP